MEKADAKLAMYTLDYFVSHEILLFSNSKITRCYVIIICYIKLKSLLSVSRHAGNSVTSAWIDVGLGLFKAVVSGM